MALQGIDDQANSRSPREKTFIVSFHSANYQFLLSRKFLEEI
jgi:hypothetical protein